MKTMLYGRMTLSVEVIVKIVYDKIDKMIRRAGLGEVFLCGLALLSSFFHLVASDASLSIYTSALET